MSDEMITMRHPTLPAHQEIVQPKDAMPHYTAAGWQLVPQAELDERAALAAAAAHAAAKAEQTSAEEPIEVAADEPDASEPADTPKRPARRAKAPQEEES